MKSRPNTLRTYWLALLFALADIALVASVYGQLPESLPMFWGADEKPVVWMTKSTGAFLLPLVHTCFTVYLATVPSVDPGAMHAAAAPRFYPAIVAAISCFLLFATGVVVAAAMGTSFRPLHALLEGFGVLVALVGNYLGKLPKNYVVGIRTPWTLSSDYVWERTHRFAAPLFMISGVALLLYCLLRGGALSGLFIAAIVIVTFLAPYCYSYVTWKRTIAASAN